MVCMYDSIERGDVNFTPSMRASLFYTACCKVGVAIANYVMKSAEMSRQMLLLPEF